MGYEQLMDSLNRRRRRKQHSLPKPASPQNLLYGRHIESELGIDVMTILECVWGKRDRCNLWITDPESEHNEGGKACGHYTSFAFSSVSASLS